MRQVENIRYPLNKLKAIKVKTAIAAIIVRISGGAVRADVTTAAKDIPSKELNIMSVATFLLIKNLPKLMINATTDEMNNMS